MVESVVSASSSKSKKEGLFPIDTGLGAERAVGVGERLLFVDAGVEGDECPIWCVVIRAVKEGVGVRDGAGPVTGAGRGGAGAGAIISSLICVPDLERGWYCGLDPGLCGVVVVVVAIEELLGTLDLNCFGLGGGGSPPPVTTVGDNGAEDADNVEI